MKHLKKFGLVVLAAIALTSSTVGAASATTLEVGGTPKNEAVRVAASLKIGSSTVISRTDGTFANTCTSTGTSMEWTTETFTWPDVEGWAFLAFWPCERPVNVDGSGKIIVKHTSGTNGTVTSWNATITVGSPFGTLNCYTGTGTHLGTLTGKASGFAEIDVNAVLNCGFLVPSAKWQGTYTVTSPLGLGVTA